MLALRGEKENFKCTHKLTRMQAANVRGAKTIIGVDRVQSRLTLAKEMGATHVIDTSSFKDVTADLPTAIREIVPMGANAIFDTTGVVPLIAGAVKALHSKGQIILIGIVDGKTMDLDLGQLLNVSQSFHIVHHKLTTLVWYRYPRMY